MPLPTITYTAVKAATDHFTSNPVTLGEGLGYSANNDADADDILDKAKDNSKDNTGLRGLEGKVARLKENPNYADNPQYQRLSAKLQKKNFNRSMRATKKSVRKFGTTGEIGSTEFLTDTTEGSVGAVRDRVQGRFQNFLDKGDNQTTFDKKRRARDMAEFNERHASNLETTRVASELNKKNTNLEGGVLDGGSGGPNIGSRTALDVYSALNLEEENPPKKGLRFDANSITAGQNIKQQLKNFR